MRIQTNVNALNAYRNLNNTNRSLSKSLERLSSGFRINRAADDAAGLAISEKMRGQIRGLNQAARNAQDGISLIQTAEGSLNETHAILQRMRELAVQAANDTLTANDRMEIQKEVDQLRTEIDRIANTTEFNTKKLLDGTTSALASTDNLATKVFMRDGLRVEDQFGQKAVGGGNFRLDIRATPGTGQIQKTDIFKVKHDQGLPGVQDNEPGEAKVHFTGLTADFDENETITMQFIIDGEQYEVVYTAVTDGEHTFQLANAINDELGHLITAYGNNADVDDLSWGVLDDFSTGNDLLLVLDGLFAEDKTRFDFWLSDYDVTDIGDIETERTTYSAEDTFINSVNVADATQMLMGDYTVDIERTLGVDIDEAEVLAQYTQSGDNLFTGVTVDETQDANISLLLEVTNVDDDEITVTYRYNIMDEAGELVAKSEGSRVLTAGEDNAGVNFGGFEFATLVLADPDPDNTFTVGDRVLINAQSFGDDTLGDRGEQIAINRDGNETMEYIFELGTADEPITVNFFQLDETTGDFTDSEVTITFNENVYAGDGLLTLNTDEEYLEGAASFSIDEVDGIGDIASENTRLYDIDRFWDASGNFFLDDPQTITLVQGDGTKASFTIFRDDTIADVVEKIDSAIRNEKTNYTPGTLEAGKGLGQGDLLNPTNADFAYYVGEGEASTGGTFDTVEGTIVINSAIAGKFGEIKFIGDEDVIKALSLSTIREAEENRFTVDVINAHSEGVVAENITITSNILVGVVHSNVDVEFDPNANVNVQWRQKVDGMNKEEYGDYAPNAFHFFSNMDTEAHGTGEKYSTFVHLADNTMVYHIGANPLQDVAASMGDMTSRSLGVHNTLVVDRDSANASIRMIDNAIDRVSAERSKLGALQNRLEHTIANLAVASENLSAAESRIRDVDMAAEMMEFTKNQILAQAGTAMLAQANMKPQMVLQLLG